GERGQAELGHVGQCGVGFVDRILAENVADTDPQMRGVFKIVQDRQHVARSAREFGQRSIQLLARRQSVKLQRIDQVVDHSWIGCQYPRQVWAGGAESHVELKRRRVKTEQ